MLNKNPDRTEWAAGERGMAIARLLGTLALVALACPAFAQTEPDVGFGDTEAEEEEIAVETDYGVFGNGYLRLGIGSTDGGDFTTFKLNGAESKYRLGNESDVYVEFGLGYRAALGNGSDFVVEAMVNGYGNSNALNNGDEFAGDSNLVQAYAGIENIGTGAFREAFLWAGRRYYRRRDVHISDFYYENMSGDGAGIENVRLGSAGLSAAAFYYDADDIGYTSAALDVRVHDIGVGDGWFGEAGAIWIDGSGDDQTGDDGYSIRFHLDNLDLGWGEMRNALMYGAGAGIEFNSTGAAYASSDDNRLRIVSQALIKTGAALESQATLVLQQSEIGGEDQTWVSTGIRPQYNFTDNWGAAVEVGFDWFDDDGDEQSLTKLTLAPFYSFGRKGFFARPQLRAFVTWANWSEVGAITEQVALGNVTDGISLGLQLESWW
jgi:maltoporin